MNVAVAVYIFTLVPEFMMRFITWVLVRTLYRVRVDGLKNVPDEGAALVVCNHVSFMDPLILMANVRRPMRFVMYYKIYNLPILRFVFRTAKAIPIAGRNEDPALMERAFELVDEALANGEVVCIFPEGGITRDGTIQNFRPGVDRILARRPVPVVPLALRGMWGSIFSRRDSALRRARLPRRFWSRIELVGGTPLRGERRQRGRAGSARQPNYAGRQTPDMYRMSPISGEPGGQDDHRDHGQPDDQHAPDDTPRVLQFGDGVAHVLHVAIAGLDVGIDAGARDGAEEFGFEARARAAGCVVPLLPCAHDGVEIRDQCHREDHQVGRDPVERVGDTTRGGARGGVERERGVTAEDLRQAIAQRAGGAEQEEPEQHAEAAAKSAEERGFDQHRGEPGQRCVVVAKRGHGFVAAKAIRCPQDGVDVAFDLARAKGVHQHDDREGQPAKVEEGQGAKDAGEDGAGDHGHQQHDGDTSGPRGVAQAVHPVTEPAIVPPAGQLRHAPGDDQGDEDGEET